MSEPEYLICLNCETPTYSFEWENDKVSVVFCTTCGSDEPAEFLTETEYEELSSRE